VGLVIGAVIAGIPAFYFSSQVSRLNSIANLQVTDTVASDQAVNQPAGGAIYWTFNAQYAGYVRVTVQSSTTSNTYVEVKGISNGGVSYDSGKLSVGYGGTVSYPVLPGTVYVGNSNLFNGASETVSVIYVY